MKLNYTETQTACYVITAFAGDLESFLPYLFKHQTQIRPNVWNTSSTAVTMSIVASTAE